MERANRNNVKFSRKNCNVLQQGRNTLVHQDTQGGQPAEEKLCGEGLECSAGPRIEPEPLLCLCLSWPSSGTLSTARARAGELCPALCSPLPAPRTCHRVQQRAAEMMEGLDISPEGRPGVLALLPAEGKARGCHKCRAKPT